MMKNINKIIEHLGGWKNALQLVKPSSNTLTIMIIVLVLIVFFPENQWGFADENKSKETQHSIISDHSDKETTSMTSTPEENTQTITQEESPETIPEESIVTDTEVNDDSTTNMENNTINTPSNNDNTVNNNPNNDNNQNPGNNEPQELITQNSKIKTFEKYDPIYDPIVDHYFNETLKMNNSFATIENSYNR